MRPGSARPYGHGMAPSDDASGPAGPAHDLRWARDARDAFRCAGVLLGLLLLVDRCAARLTPWRAVLWCVLAGLLFLALFPARVSAGGNWLASRRLGREHRVRTDLLVSVRYLTGVSQRLVLRDSLGGRVEIDPEVLVRNPPMWIRLDEGARKAVADGSLLCGATALGLVSRRVEHEAAEAVFRTSGLE